MRRIMSSFLAGCFLAAGACVGQAASELTGSPPGKSPPSRPPTPVTLPELTPPAANSCGNNGTAVHFEDTPSAAARKARKEHKLVFVLHVSGLFEDPRVT